MARRQRQTQQWIKKGLLFAPQSGVFWLATHAAVPIADKLSENKYRVYFSGRDTLNRSQAGFIEIDMQRPDHLLALSAEPVLASGTLGAFDDSGVVATWLVNHRNEKYLYYVGCNLGVTVPFRNSIGLAISRDQGRTFIPYSKAPILDRGEHDPYFLASPCVLVENGVWRMWYVSCVAWELEEGKPKHRYHIKYAESMDGIRWRREGLVCIDFQSVEEYAISRPCVLKENGLYKMWYSYRGESYRIGYAESGDGLHWERKDQIVRLAVSDSGWDAEMIEYAFVFDHQGERYMLYNGNGYGRTGIGLAVLAKE